ncbi:cation diffusion facilitator family transporter [uncultured Odoribacter sp.]|uniref:cation diffusion facilitator family transporter n=1 Tax=uncultured Odoribacter sp. TaxID=876416 RepID=UPI002637938E|nr:cation diffusion facilitator family transporter [uncultured Odoribacter sp.]
MNANNKLGYREGVVSVVLNLLLFLLKYYAGVVSFSVALVADAWHTLSDSLTSLVVIFGIRMSSRKPDKEHPFGHGRWEQISAIIIALLLSVVGLEFVKDSIGRLHSHETAYFGWWAYGVTLVSIAVKEGLARYAFRIARITGNASVKADGWHHRSDALSSLVVLGGLFLSPYVWWVDSALGIVISILLFYAAYGIIREAVNKILGEEPSEELLLQVKGIVRQEMGEIAYPHHFHIHNYGEYAEFIFHVKVPGHQTVKEAHELATKIENRIEKELHLTTTIHVEPLD